MDAWTLARLAGHSNIKQSMTYVHPTDKSLHAAIDRMSELPSAAGGDKSGDNDETRASDAEPKLPLLATNT
jgi:hypothetical protein